MESATKKIKSPRLVIIDHCDDLIRELDIYTEELQERFKQDDTLDTYEKSLEDVEEMNEERSEDSDDDDDDVENDIGISKQDVETFGVDARLDPYTSKYVYPDASNQELVPSSMRVKDDVNLVREGAIEEIKRVQKETRQLRTHASEFI